MVTVMTKLRATALALGIAWFSPSGLAVDVNISVDNNPVTSGSSFTLMVIADDHLSRTAWQPEQQLDQFRVLSTSVSSSTQIINGQTSRSTEFRTVLQAPTEPGIYRIGPVQVAGALSNSIELEVQPLSAEQQAQQIPAAFMEVELDRDQLYVQQQLQMTAKLYLGANLLSGNILPPQLENAEISQLGKDQESYEMRNGKRFQVFKRVYLITPQRSGELVIKAPVFNGQINSGRSLSPFSSMSGAETVTTAAPPLTIRVLPVPPDWPATASWLPAELATISVDLNPDEVTQGKVGEPLTLKYRVTAIGVQSDLLPRFIPAAINNADSYAEPSQRQTSERNGKLVAQQLTQVTIIPRQSGRLTIPAQELVWFNTVSGRIERSISQPLDIDIAAASGLQPQAPQTAVAVTQPLDTIATPALLVNQHNNAGWWPYLMMLVIALWAATTVVLLWQLQRLRLHSQQPAITTPVIYDFKQLRKACADNHAEHAELALKHWAQHQLGLTPPYLPSLANYFNHAPLRSQLEHLSQCRYAADQAPWQEGKALWRAVQAVQRQTHAVAAQSNILPPLYPG